MLKAGGSSPKAVSARVLSTATSYGVPFAKPPDRSPALSRNARSLALREALEPLAVIQAVRKLLVLLSHRKQLLAHMLDRLSFGHAAEFVGFLFVVRRSFFGG